MSPVIAPAGRPRLGAHLDQNPFASCQRLVVESDEQHDGVIILRANRHVGELDRIEPLKKAGCARADGAFNVHTPCP